MHLHVPHHSVSWGSQVRVLRRSKVPWDSQFRREGVYNSYENFLSNSSGCRVPAPSVPALRSKEPRVNKRKLQGRVLKLTHSAADLAVFFFFFYQVVLQSQTRKLFPGGREPFATSILLKPTPYPAASILSPLSKTYGKKNLKMSKLEWTLEIILFSLSFYK